MEVKDAVIVTIKLLKSIRVPVSDLDDTGEKLKVAVKNLELIVKAFEDNESKEPEGKE